MVWDWIIALYLFLAGLGSGAFIFAALVKPENRKLRLGAMIIAVVAVAVGTLMLMVDAKAGFANPGRFFLLISNLSSVMAWGVILLSLFLIAAFIDCILVAKKKDCKALDIAGAILAAGVATYTGVLLGVVMAYPLWNAVVLPVLFVVSALGSGFGAAGLFGFFAVKDELAKVDFKAKFGIILPIVEAVLIAILLIVTAGTTGFAASAADASVANIISGKFAVVFWVGVVLVGIVLPLLTELKAAADKKAEKDGSALIAAGDACAVIGAFCLRFIIVLAAVAIIL